MNIWILNHYAGTPDTTPATRTYDLSRELVKRGHTVTILTSSFSEYTFEEMRLEPSEKWKVEYCNGVRLVWLKTARYKGNHWRRILNILSYTWRSFWIGVGIKQKPDVIIGVSVHPLAALSAYALSRFKKSRFFFEITDLWPQVLIEVGRLSTKNPITWGLKLLEKFLYQKAEKTIAYWPHVDDYMAKVGIPRHKFAWIPHLADFSRYKDLTQYDGGTSKEFTIMYLGRHAMWNALDVILKAAQILQKAGGNSVRFVFVGAGPEKANLIKLAKVLQLTNVEFRDAVAKQHIAGVMSEADAFIDEYRNVPLLQYGISTNKLCDYLASGRPILFGGNPKKNPVKDAKAGISYPAENPKALAEAVNALVSMNPNERILMGKNGIEYVKKHHDIQILTDRLEALL